MIWKILEIEETKDKELITAAYREKLRYVNPEDDEEGFKELRRAFEEAMEYADLPEGANTEEEDGEYQGKKTEVDKWVDKFEKIYSDVTLRRDEANWTPLLNDPLCEDLDTELEAGEKLLVFFMSHSYLPQNIWKLVDKRFRYMENYEQLKEKFPENYLEYVKWQIENEDFFDFDLFDGKTDDNVDEFINGVYRARNYVEQRDLESAQQCIKELKRFDISHPFAQVEEAEYLLLKGKEDNGLDYFHQALSIMEELDFEYSDNGYVERVYADTLVANGKPEKAQEIYEALIEKDKENIYAFIGKANCIYRMGDLEEAKEQLEDVLEEQVQNTKCLELLDEINGQLAKGYEKALEEKMDAETCYKLGWCYYQQKKFEEGIRLLDQLEEQEEYDYVNLRCRLYLANDDYELAYPLAKKWLQLIEEAVDDGSKEAMKKKNRLTLANYSIGICMMMVDFKKAETEEAKEKAYATGVEYFNKAVEGEKNLLVRLSYKEQLARFCLEAKQYEKCVEVCTEIIQEDRGYFPAYVHRQQANSELRNAKEVIDDFFACKEIYPAFIKPYLLAAEVFFAFEQYDDIESVIRDAKEAGLESDTLKLYEIRMIHYKEFSKENTEKALAMMKELRETVYNKKSISEADKTTDEADITDIEDFAELEKEFAIIYWDLDDATMTLGVINSYLEKDADNLTMLQLKSDVLNREKKPEEALEICKKLTTLAPQNLYFKIKLGGCYERMRDYDKAIQTYEDILKIDSSYERALARLMYIYSFLSNREKNLDKCRTGIEYATRLIEVTGTAEGYVERGNLLIDLYELEQAIEDCKKAIELDPEAFYAYNNLGCALLKLRRIDEAIEPLKKVIEMKPDYDNLPYVNLAECYTIQKQYEKAMELYNKIMEIWPERVGYREEVAQLYAKLGNYKKAMELFDGIADAYNGNSKDKKSNNYLANSIEACCDNMKLCLECGNYKLGERYVKKAMKLLKKYSGDHFPAKIDNIIEFYRDQNNDETAYKYANKLLSIAKKRGYYDYGYRSILFAYTTVLFGLGKMEQAKQYADLYLKKVFEAEGSMEELFADRRYIPMYSYNFAIMSICSGDTEKACEYLSRIPDCKFCVMCMNNDCFEYYFGMGLIAEVNGRLQEAKSFYEKAIEIKGRYLCAENHLRIVNKKIQSGK